MNWIKKILFPVFCLFLLFGAVACGIYDFKGSNISKDVETFSVDLFGNEAQLVNPQLSLLFTEKLKTKFQRETKLHLITENGDWRFAGAIREYKIEPVIIDNNTGASQNQFTIGVHVVFENEKDPTKNFSKDFSFNRTFDASKEFSSVENELSDEITDNIVQQIFAATALDW
ncbi:MAG: hypothetical protein KG003_11130 [Bacteroidetes bacterium]|nr:hypothetical protein [Bacteroidota bacterium]